MPHKEITRGTNINPPSILSRVSKSTREANPQIFGESLTDVPEQSVVPKGIIKRTKTPNKTEAEFGLILEARKQKGEIEEYAFEPFSLRYGDNAFYKPDWVTREGGKVTIAQLAKLCEYKVIDMAGDKNLWWNYTDVVRQCFFTIIEVKGGRIYPEAKPRFKAAKERHQWANFELWQKKACTWTRLL